MANWSIGEFLMALLAHYLFNESPYTTATTATDIAEGGSGNHDGTYTWMGNGDGILSGGVGGRHISMKYSSGSSTTLVSTFTNNSDFILHGEMTLSFWIYPINVGQHLIGVDAGTGGEDDNIPWVVRWWASGVLDIAWEYGSQSPSGTIATTSGFLDINEWQHIVIRRSLYSGGPNMQIDFYKAGVKEETYDNSGAGYNPPTGGSNTTMRIGKIQCGWNVGGQAMADSVRIYNTAESDGNISALYATEEEDFYGSPGEKFLSTPFDRRFLKTSSNHLGDIIMIGARSSRDNPGFYRDTA
jgi:hypothetical protein